MLNPSEEERDKARKGTVNYLKYSGMAFQMIGILLVCVLGGIWLDGRLGTNPWLTVFLSLVGVGGGLYVSLKDFI